MNVHVHVNDEPNSSHPCTQWVKHRASKGWCLIRTGRCRKQGNKPLLAVCSMAKECYAHSVMPARCVPRDPVRLPVPPCTVVYLQPSGRLQTWRHGCRPCSSSWTSCSTCLRVPGTNGECLPATNAHIWDLAVLFGSLHLWTYMLLAILGACPATEDAALYLQCIRAASATQLCRPGV